ncbi:MAG TPA: saccharopine dehydrogenase NADP-binding domain-containing protein [Gemmatimonadaceae bacterium]|nr:saccharopine dehydrogenase NADP-binding domain-containing protein [Gemmatimonadaceae bacterium]
MLGTVAPIAVYGASGHTGTFVVNELRRRGLPLVAVGRNSARLPAGVPSRTAPIDDSAALDRAFAGCAAVINCAGPFLDTAAPVVEAALRAGCSYLDITAEQASARATFEAYDEPARAAGITVMPAASFYGGLADLLASALVGDGHAEELTIAIALDHWWPTEGTRRTGARNVVPRVIIEHGQLGPMTSPPSRIDWTFEAPFGPQQLVEMAFSEVITISRHLSVQRLRSYLTSRSIDEVCDAATPQPAAVDASGRSAQRFAMEVVVADVRGTHRATASGQDIYAVSAPIVVEAAVRILEPAFARRGALALGQAFDPKEFLRALSPAHLAVELVQDGG